jgi:hypothetical protein
MNNHQELERAKCRARYLDEATKTCGLSFGIKESLEFWDWGPHEANPFFNEVGPSDLPVNFSAIRMSVSIAGLQHLTARQLLSHHFSLSIWTGCPPTSTFPVSASQRCA